MTSTRHNGYLFPPWLHDMRGCTLETHNYAMHSEDVLYAKTHAYLSVMHARGQRAACHANVIRGSFLPTEKCISIIIDATHSNTELLVQVYCLAHGY